MAHAQGSRSRDRAETSSLPTTILWAGAAAVVPTLIRLAADHVVSDVTIFPAYFPFVLAAATFLGWRSAIVTTILSALAANFMFMGARFAFSTAATDIGSTLLFLVSAIAVIIGVERLKSSARATDLDQGAPRAARGLSKGHCLLLATLLSLGAWGAMIWGSIHLIRIFTGS
jgi:K+-sensing histidine kinase KdpD